jgi:hypothetical protein
MVATPNGVPDDDEYDVPGERATAYALWVALVCVRG